MAIPELFGDANATLGVALAVGWVAVLAVGLYQYRQGGRSRDRFYMTVSVGGFWLAFSLIQVSTALTGVAEKGVVALAIGLFCAGIATGIRWWSVRNSETDP